MLPTELDSIDWKILDRLQQDARIANVDLARAVNLSPSPCLNRVRQLEAGGVVSRYVTLLDPLKLGLTVSVFIQVSLEKQDDRKQRDFLACVEAEEHIVECHAMSGSHDYLLKVVARSMDHFSDLSMNRILKFPGVKDIESNFSLMAIKESSALPVR